MKLYMKQIHKEMFNAEFNIESESNTVGSIFVKGNMHNMEGNTTIKYNNRTIELKHKNKMFGSKYRYYEVLENNQKIGEIYQRREKKGIFNCIYVPTLCIKEKTCSDYGDGIGFAMLDGLQINGDKYSVKIINELYNFNIECDEDEDMIIRTLIYTIYTYITTWFVSGQKTTQSEINLSGDIGAMRTDAYNQLIRNMWK